MSTRKKKPFQHHYLDTVFKLKNIPLAAILTLASFMRLYRIEDYMTFLGDEGRDAIVAREILHGDLTLLGPRASAGDFFLGPIYYYMITPFLWLWNYDPVGPAIMVALFGIATVFLIYYVTKDFFGYKAALIASVLYAVSPVVISFSRSSWNPNPMPFFSLLTFYTLYKAVKKTSWKLFVLVGLLLGIMLQLHYLATFVAVIIAAFILVGNIVKDKGIQFVKIAYQYLGIFVGFLIGFSPFLAFEVRHNFPNIRTILGFVTENTLEDEYETQNDSYLEVVQNVAFRLFARLVTRFPPPEQVAISENNTLILWEVATVVLAVASIIFLLTHRKKLQTTLLITWLVLGVALFGVYKREIYDYYFTFLFPLPFILVGYLFASTFQKSKKSLTSYILKAASVAAVLTLLVVNLYGHPFRFSANKQKNQAETIANFVLDKTNGEPYNFALLTSGNSDHVYRYFFEVADHTPVTIENPQKDPLRETVTDQLLIVCESYTCEPLGNSLWEVAGFGPAEIVGEWKVSVVRVFKLVPLKEESS